ncbi:hypothetical protein V1477_003767 [Vespula maculifrons]|uniref:Uncharacterized protein n=1 Tax=Vespula maculifrons TaxID=7453 RepID=A0ABD2CRZ8_VESMC
MTLLGPVRLKTCIYFLIQTRNSEYSGNVLYEKCNVDASFQRFITERNLEARTWTELARDYARRWQSSIERIERSVGDDDEIGRGWRRDGGGRGADESKERESKQTRFYLIDQ